MKKEGGIPKAPVTTTSLQQVPEQGQEHTKLVRFKHKYECQTVPDPDR